MIDTSDVAVNMLWKIKHYGIYLTMNLQRKAFFNRYFMLLTEWVTFLICMGTNVDKKLLEVYDSEMN